MDLYWRFSLLIVTTTAVSLNIPSTHSDYYFLTHTFSDLSCDPYASEASNSLALECSVLGPRITTTSSFKIVWHRTLKNTSTTQNLNNLYTNQSELVKVDEQKVAISTFSEIVIVRSVLTVTNLNTNNVSGKYWCTVEERGQIKVLMSLVSPLILHPSSVYRSLEACPKGVIHTAVANKTISSATSSTSNSFTTSTPLTSSHSTSMSTIENANTDDGLTVNSWTTGGITFTGPETTMPLSFLEMTWNIIFTVTIGVLFFAVHILLVILGCLCCRGKEKISKKENESLPLHPSSTTSLNSTSSIPEVNHVLPNTSLPVPPITFTTTPPSSSPPELELLSISQKRSSPPKMKKLPRLPACSVMPSRFMHQIVVPPSINADQLHVEREKTNSQARYGREEEKIENEVSCSISSQTKPPGPLKISLGDTTGVPVVASKQGKRLVFPMNTNNLPNTINNNKGVRRLPAASLASMQVDDNRVCRLPAASFASMQIDDNTANKYKSLNKEMMEGFPVYEYPTRTRSSGANRPLEIAIEHAHLFRLNDAMRKASAARESLDGEYVLPNEVVQQVSTSLSKGLATRELSDYIIIS